MPAQHKRPGRTARKARQERAIERERERQRRREAVVVHFPRRWDPEYMDDISPGRCIAWAEGAV